MSRFRCAKCSCVPIFPQLGPVVLQARQRTAGNILADMAGKRRTPFPYHDKGIITMISLNAPVVEVEERRHELHGPVAVAAWLGVHAYLMCGVRTRAEAFIDSIWTGFTRSRGPRVLDRSTPPASTGRKTKMWRFHPHFPVLPRCHHEGDSIAP
jgi:hypothetical protein